MILIKIKNILKIKINIEMSFLKKTNGQISM